MRVAAITWILLVLYGPVLPPWVSAQPAATPDNHLTPERRQELSEILHVITSVRNDAQTRRFGAERLFRSGLPTRIDRAIELLSSPASVGTRMAVCEAIVSVGRRHPDLLDDRLIEPLLNLLGHENDDLSTAAATAISMFHDGHVARRLGAMAADDQRSIAQRMAAIDALALNADDQDAVRELIALLGTEDKRIVAGALDALGPASRLDYGNDIAAWQSWWEQKSVLEPRKWLEDRLELAVTNYRTLLRDYQELEQAFESRNELVAQRFDELLGTIYQLTPQPAQREARLQQWLDDSLADYRLGALGMIRARIIEGDAPSPAIHEAVVNACADGEPEVRIAALEIIGSLKNPDDAPVVLELLEREQVPRVRATMLRVLGRLENAAALDALIAELNNTSADLPCVRESARALATLGAYGRVDPALIEPAVEPLRRRFEQAPADNLPLREALLQAMAAIGDASFESVFVENLSAEEPELLLAAMRGIRVIVATEHMDHLLMNLAHADPRVRQVAAEAVGALGDATHLEALLNRLTPNVEPSDGVREAAWGAFRAILARLQSDERLRWAQRLSDRPELQMRLLTEMIEDWSANGVSPPEQVDARERLVAILMAQQKFGEAVPHLLQLRRHYLEFDPARAADLGVKLVVAVLRSGRHERLSEIITEVVQTGDEAAALAIMDAVEAHFRELTAGDTPKDRLDALVERLRTLPPELLGPQWPQRLEQMDAAIRVSEDTETGDAGPHSP